MLAGILLSAFATLAAACGDNGDELTLEEYFTQLDTAMDDLAQRVSDNASEEPNIFAPLEEQREIIISFWTDFSEQVGGVFIDDMEALDPPQEAQDAHDDLLQAAQEFVENVAEAVTNFESATSEADYEEAFELLERGGNPSVACEKLQVIADENEIEVMLNCELE